MRARRRWHAACVGAKLRPRTPCSRPSPHRLPWNPPPRLLFVPRPPAAARPSRYRRPPAAALGTRRTGAREPHRSRPVLRRQVRSRAGAGRRARRGTGDGDGGGPGGSRGCGGSRGGGSGCSGCRDGPRCGKEGGRAGQEMGGGVVKWLRFWELGQGQGQGQGEKEIMMHAKFNRERKGSVWVAAAPLPAGRVPVAPHSATRRVPVPSRHVAPVRVAIGPVHRSSSRAASRPRHVSRDGARNAFRVPCGYTPKSSALREFCCGLAASAVASQAPPFHERAGTTSRRGSTRG